MTAPRLALAICACGHAARLPVRADCPRCGASHYDRVTDQRIAVMRAIAAGEQPLIVANMRKWMLRRGLIVPTGEPPRTEPVPKYRKLPRRGYVLTRRGRLVLHAADDRDAAVRAEQIGGAA